MEHYCAARSPLMRLALAGLILAAGVILVVTRPWKVSLNERAASAWTAGRADEAFVLYEKSLARIVSGSKGTTQQVQALLGSARVLYHARGDLAGGLERLERALILAREANESKLEADVLSDLGRYYWWYVRDRERPEKEFYEPALRIYQSLDDRRGIAGATARLALVDLHHRRFDQCARRLEESQAIYEELNDYRGLQDIHYYRGAMATGKQQFEQAAYHYDKALALAKKQGDVVGRRQILSLMADLRVRRGHFEQALAIYDQMISEPLPDVTRYNTLQYRGHTLLHLGRPEDGEKSYLEALEVAQRLPILEPRKIAPTWVMISHARRMAGDLSGAAAALNASAAIPIAKKGWSNAVTELLARADLFDQQGRKKESLHALLAAEEIESHAFGTTRSHFFTTQYQQVWNRLISLLFEDVVTRDEAERLVFRLLEQMRYRSLRGTVARLAAARKTSENASTVEVAAAGEIDRISVELNKEWTSEGWSSLRLAYQNYEDVVLRSQLNAEQYGRIENVRPVGLETVQQQLDDETAIIEYVIASDPQTFADRAFALVIRRDHLRSVLLPAPSSQIETQVKLFRDLLSQENNDDWLPLAEELGRQLIQPLLDDGVLTGTKEWIVVPMGFLHDLPFAALRVNNPRSSFLVENAALTLTPSVSRWLQKSNSQKNNGVAVFGLRDAGDVNLPLLAFAEEEATAIAALTNGTAHIGDDVSETFFKTTAPNARWLHVAAHGVTEPRLPLHSGLRLRGDATNDGRLTVREILRLNLDAEIVTLSACGSGLSTGGRADVDRTGFVEAFLHAGAHNVVAALLPVSDQASVDLMVEFYQRLKTQSASQALAGAQREMLADGDYRHPRYWAPFVLIGTRAHR